MFTATSALVLAGCTAAPVEAGGTSSSPTVTASPEATYLSTVTVDPLLPSAERLTAGVFGTTDAQWLVASVTATSAVEDTDSTLSADATYLIAPDGTRFELPDLGDVRLDQWLPGTSLALAHEFSDAGTRVVEVDLETGQVTRPVDLDALRQDSGLEAPGASVTFVGDGTTDLLVSVSTQTAGVVERITVDGQVLVRVEQPWRTLIPSPDGRQLLAFGAAGHPVVVDAATLAVVADPADPGDSCTTWSWIDAGRWLARCLSASDEHSWFVTGVDTTPWQIPVAPPAWLYGLGGSPDGSVLLRVTEADPNSGGDVFRATPETLESVDTPLTVALRAHGTTLLGSLGDVDAERTDSGWSTPLVTSDTVTGSTITLVPIPEPDGAQSTVTFPGLPGNPGLGGLSFTADGRLDLYSD